MFKTEDAIASKASTKLLFNGSGHCPCSCREMGPVSLASLWRYHLQRITKVLGSPCSYLRRRKEQPVLSSLPNCSSLAGIFFETYLGERHLFPLSLNIIPALCRHLSSLRRMFQSIERRTMQRNTQSSRDVLAIPSSGFLSRFPIMNPSCKEPSQTHMSTISFCCLTLHFN